MFRFKFSLSSFRLCRRKTTSSAATHFFSPINPKAVEISYPAVPSPPPTTPTNPPNLCNFKSKTPPITTTTEAVSNHRKTENMKGCDCDEEESGWFGYVKDGGGRRRRRGKMRESVAVEKWSEEPYEEFKRAMLEMILEKEMLEAKELEELLQCYLSLNSRHHHADIVAAFTEVWELLFY